MKTKKYIANIKLAVMSVFVFLSFAVKAEVVECATIAEIKQQANGTEIKYTGTAQTTFYNDSYNGLFVEDATGGILLKGYTRSSKSSDKVKDNMSVTGLVGTVDFGDAGKPWGLKITDKKAATVSDSQFTPARVTMSDFLSNLSAYEGKAIVITNAETRQQDNKYYLDDLYFFTTPVSTKAPAAGEFAGCYVGKEYNRFIFCSAEYSKATEFFSFSDMSAYYKGKNIEIVDAKVRGSVFVNYVDKNKKVVFAQYQSVSGVINGLSLFVDGDISFNVGDEINGFYGKYTSEYKNIMTATDFKGAYFNQNSAVKLNVVTSGNKLEENADVNITSLLSHKTSALLYHAQVIYSKYSGNLYLASNGKYYYKVTYQQSKGGDDDGFEYVTDSICVVPADGFDLSKFLGDSVLLRGVYDASVVNEQPTLIIRNAADFVQTYYEFATIADMVDFGEMPSSLIEYELTGEVVVNYKRSQNKGTINWAFVEDETGVLAINCLNTKFSYSSGDRVKGIKGVFACDKKHLPNITLSNDATIELVSSDNELNMMRASLLEVIRDTMKYAGHLVEVYNVRGDSIQYENHDGSLFWSYFIEENGYRMNYSFPKTKEEAQNGSDYQAAKAFVGLNTVEAFVNFNCLDGGYVIYEISRSQQDSLIVDVMDVEDTNVNIYSSNGLLYVEPFTEQDIEIYTIDGLLYYSKNNTLGIVVECPNGIVIVKVGNRIYKSFVK